MARLVAPAGGALCAGLVARHQRAWGRRRAFQAGLIVAMLASLPIGWLCFRLRGPYFSLATLAVAEIVRLVVLNWESLTAGPMGLQITTLPPVRWFGKAIDWESKLPFYYMVAALTAFAMGVTWFVSRSRLGAYLLAIREDTDSAEADIGAARHGAVQETLHEHDRG